MPRSGCLTLLGAGGCREVAQQAEGPLAISLVAMGADSKDPSAQQVVRALVEAATRDHRVRPLQRGRRPARPIARGSV
jgi:hypothetical protein